ncbi:MAG TPA: hypothetical protein VIH60_08940 [Steroidobacteraceae bacterium]|jgi:hypothetical protein
MLEPHVPEEAIHSWKGFLVHIAAIVIGLLIAVALEQSVEFFHHRHQRLQLEEQMHEVLEDNTQTIAVDTKQLTALRAYLVELQTAVAARRHGQSLPAAPTGNNPGVLIRLPSLAPYEAAKENGTVALLSSQRIRLYNRLALQRDLLRGVYDHWFEDLAAMDAFVKRFDYSAGSTLRGNFDLAALSPAELTEYQALIATTRSRVEWMIRRMHLMAVEGRAILDGARDESDLAKAVFASPEADSGASSAGPPVSSAPK